MTNQEFEEAIAEKDFVKNSEKLTEALDFLYKLNQKTLKDICDIIIARYDSEITKSKIDIEANAKAISDLEKINWQENCE